MTGRILSPAPGALLFVLAVLLAAGPPAPTQGPAGDYARTDPKSLGVAPVPARKDPKTGFIVGGKNPSSLIPKLTEIAGRPIADLEKDMRPGGNSTAGFLGRDEHLLEVLLADNRYVVDHLGLTHQQLARPLRVLGAVAVKLAAKKPQVVTYQGRKFRIKATIRHNSVDSPFDDGTETNCEATVENLANGKKLTYSLLVPQMIERYGFYEGKGTPYRVEPRAIVEVFDFLKKSKGR